MNAVIFYITRQRNGWSVERDGVVQSGHAQQDAAIACAHKAAGQVRAKGLSSSVRIQEDAGRWREERSFSPNS